MNELRTPLPVACAPPLHNQLFFQEELLDFQDILEDVRLTINDKIIKTGAVITSLINVT
jgi:hypothetical protein